MPSHEITCYTPRHRIPYHVLGLYERARRSCIARHSFTCSPTSSPLSLSFSLSIDRSPIYCSLQILTVLLSIGGRGGGTSFRFTSPFFLSAQPKFFPPCVFIIFSRYFPLSSSSSKEEIEFFSILFFLFWNLVTFSLSRLITSSRYIRSLFIDRYVSFIQPDNRRSLFV